jgi:capsular polysaccharide biosynthesis protein
MGRTTHEPPPVPPQLRNDVRAAAGGRRVIVADWGTLSTRGQLALALSADMVLAVHGAGTVNSLFARPGTAWVDLLPPRATQYAPTFLSTAQRLGLHWYTLPLAEANCSADPHDQPFFSVFTMAARAFVALALGSEA